MGQQALYLALETRTSVYARARLIPTLPLLPHLSFRVVELELQFLNRFALNIDRHANGNRKFVASEAVMQLLQFGYAFLLSHFSRAIFAQFREKDVSRFATTGDNLLTRKGASKLPTATCG